MLLITEEETQLVSRLSFYERSYRLLSSMTHVYTLHSTVCFLKLYRKLLASTHHSAWSTLNPLSCQMCIHFQDPNEISIPSPMPCSSSPQAKFTMFFPKPLLASWLPSTYSSVLQLIDFLDCFPLRLNSLSTGTNIIFIIVFPNGSTKSH